MLRSSLTNCKSVLVLLMFTILATSCSVSRKVERRGGYLLTKNIIKVDRQGIEQSDLLNFAQPKPNRKFLGLIRSRVWLWDATIKKPNRGFNKWILKNFAEQPVLLDTAMAHNSLIPMKQYLINKGYFNSSVTSSVKIKKSRAEVTYTTHTAEPFKFGEITWDISDDTISGMIMKDVDESLLKSGNQYDAYLMSYERDRLTQLLKNNGYYAFTSDYVFLEVDTLKTQGIAHVKIIVKNKEQGSKEDKHKRYLLNKILVNTDSPGLLTDTVSNFDTITYNRTNAPSMVPDLYVIYQDKLKLRPEALARAVHVRPGEYYSQKNINLTYNRLQNLGLTRYVSINLFPPKDTVIKLNGAQELLDTEIKMVKAPVSMFTIEAEGTNASGFMGIGASVNYQNRNIFMGAETWRIRAFGSFETRPTLIGDDGSFGGIFNSVGWGFETGIDFPTLLSPIPVITRDQNARLKTSLNLGFSYELRSEYERNLAKLSLVYEWNATPTSRHFLSPIDLSSVSIIRTDEFTNYLTQLEDPRFLNQYTNHLVLASKYSFVFNNQNITDRRNFSYFRINLESAGNLLNLVSSITSADRDQEGKYTLFDLKYAQYVRTDWDFRYYKPIAEKQRLVYRLAFGIGIPYGNSISLPFEKGFFAGGANGMRGWAVRSLGPGEYKPDNTKKFENVGDLWAEGNIEYRFPLYRYLNGGLFTDIGNIWLLKENQDFVGGKFTFDRALKSLAWDAGFGIRFDFSIFVFRIDGAVQLYNPGKEIDNRFITSSPFELRDINWNFGIGYPF